MTIHVPPDQLELLIEELTPRQPYQFAVRAWTQDGPGEAAYFNVVVPYGGVVVPSPAEPLPRPDAASITDWWTVRWGSFNGWEFGDGTVWSLVSADGFPDMMSLKTSDAQLAGDGELFGIDSEEKRVLTLELDGGLTLIEHCFPPVRGELAPDRIQEARCANLRRHQDLPLVINDRWMVMARPRRFLIPQRAREAPRLTVSYEAQDPAIYSAGEQEASTGLGFEDRWRSYPRPSGSEGQTPGRWPPWAGWRYEGTGEAGLLEIVNEGCRETYLRARITGPVAAPIIVNQTTFERLELDLELRRGEWVDLDFRLGSVMLNGTASRYYAVTRESSWFSCAPGRTLINYLCRGEVTDSTLTAWYRSAW